MTQSALERRCEALENQVALLKAAIKETWSFIKYELPLSLEVEVAKQPTLKNVDWNRKAFQPLLDATLNEATKILQTTNEPVHYTVIVDQVERKHEKLVARYSNPNIAGKVRDLAVEKWLLRVGKGMYFYGPKMAEAGGSGREHTT